MPAIPQVTPRTVHKICEETRAPVAASAAQSRPECCAITPRLVHRCNLSPHSHPQTVLNFPRRYTDLCGHRRACADALLLGWRAQASRGTHTDCTAGEATDRGPAHGRPSMPLDCLQYCSGYCDTALLQAYGRGSSIFRLERGLRTASQAMPQ